MVIYQKLFLIFNFFIFFPLCSFQICSFQTFKKNTVAVIHKIDDKLLWIPRKINLGHFSSFVALYDKMIHKKPFLDAPAFRLNFSLIDNPLSAIAFSFTYNRLKKIIEEQGKEKLPELEKEDLKITEKMIDRSLFRYTLDFASNSYKKREYVNLIEFGLRHAFSLYGLLHNAGFFKAALAKGKFPRLKKLDTFIGERAAPWFYFSAPLLLWILNKNKKNGEEPEKKNSNFIAQLGFE